MLEADIWHFIVKNGAMVQNWCQLTDQWTNTLIREVYQKQMYVKKKKKKLKLIF